MTDNLFLSSTDVNLCRLGEELRSNAGVLDDEQRHDDVGSHIVETTGEEVVLLLITIVLNLLDSLLIQRNELLDTSEESLHIVADLLGKHLLDDVEVGAVGDVADSCDNLELCCSLIDREDAGVAIEALALVLHDET